MGTPEAVFGVVLGWERICEAYLVEMVQHQNNRRDDGETIDQEERSPLYLV